MLEISTGRCQVLLPDNSVKSLKLENLREALPRHPGVAWMRQVGCDIWCFIRRFIGCCTSSNIIYLSYLYVFILIASTLHWYSWIISTEGPHIGIQMDDDRDMNIFYTLNSYVNHFQIMCQAFFQRSFLKSCRQISRLVRSGTGPDWCSCPIERQFLGSGGRDSVQHGSVDPTWFMMHDFVQVDAFFHSIYMMSMHYLWSFQ